MTASHSRKKNCTHHNIYTRGVTPPPCFNFEVAFQKKHPSTRNAFQGDPPHRAQARQPVYTHIHVMAGLWLGCPLLRKERRGVYSSPPPFHTPLTAPECQPGCASGRGPTLFSSEDPNNTPFKDYPYTPTHSWTFVVPKKPFPTSVFRQRRGWRRRGVNTHPPHHPPHTNLNHCYSHQDLH